MYFNLDLDDLRFFKYDNGYPLFVSDFLNNIWSKGFVSVGCVDIGSACYIARYCDKKLSRPNSEKVVLSSFGVQPEFSVMSRRPGIASDYLDKIIDNVKNGIYLLSCKGQDFSIPIYYSKKVKELLAGTDYLKIYEDRNDLLIKNKINNDLLLSDILSSCDLQDYYFAEDIFRKSCKKVRDNIKLY